MLICSSTAPANYLHASATGTAATAVDLSPNLALQLCDNLCLDIYVAVCMVQAFFRHKSGCVVESETEGIWLCRQEQEVLEAAAQHEHKAALAAVAAAAKSAKQDLQQMRDAAQHMAWRTQRWRVAQLRRAALEV